MSYFEDLSDYRYFVGGFRAGTVNIGWLEDGHAFNTAPPENQILDLLWEFCRVSVTQARGYHMCDLCAPPKLVVARRSGREIHLGCAEIRVFAGHRIYAAPNLIYHYVRTHHYRPPEEFIRAIETNGKPDISIHLKHLKAFDLAAHEVGSTISGTATSGSRSSGFRFEKVTGKCTRTKVAIPTHIDKD